MVGRGVFNGADVCIGAPPPEILMSEHPMKISWKPHPRHEVPFSARPTLFPGKMEIKPSQKYL